MLSNVHNLKKYFTENRKVEAEKFKATRAFIFLTGVALTNLFAFVIVDHHLMILKNVLFAGFLISIAFFVAKIRNYLNERNNQARYLIYNETLKELLDVFICFDTNEYVLNNLRESNKLNEIVRKNKIPKNLYYDYICCCIELSLRLSMYKKVNEKAPGTFSHEINQMFLSSNL
jgi:hypothetical protein